MSTVLWANFLSEGQVTSDESDKYALYKYASKLDSICKKVQIPAFSEIFDTTDAQFNVDQIELEPGMESTDEFMAKNGHWMNADHALEHLTTLLENIQAENTRFGIIGNAHDDVVRELKESIEFARKAAAVTAQFNFSVVT